MNITIVFKNGYSLYVTCDEFTITRDTFGHVNGYKFKGLKGCEPLYISFDDVICVYRDLDEEAEAENDIG